MSALISVPTFDRVWNPSWRARDGLFQRFSEAKTDIPGLEEIGRQSQWASMGRDQAYCTAAAVAEGSEIAIGCANSPSGEHVVQNWMTAAFRAAAQVGGQPERNGGGGGIAQPLEGV